MKRVIFIRFEQGEQDQIARALDGIISGDDSREEPNLLRRFRNSAAQGEPFALQRLIEVHAELGTLIETFQPQTTAQWWRDAGAPGANDAVEGLAAERVAQIERLVGVRRLVKAAAQEIRPGRSFPLIEEVGSLEELPTVEEWIAAGAPMREVPS